jgi:DnaJ-class molecular chaperone
VGIHPQLNLPRISQKLAVGSAQGDSELRHVRALPKTSGPEGMKAQMKRPDMNPTEQKCPGCNGTGFQAVKRPARPGIRIFPAKCEQCLGKGRIPA